MSTHSKNKPEEKQTKADLHTDEPLSEKDEVKKAEERTAKTQKNNSEKAAAGLKNTAR